MRWLVSGCLLLCACHLADDVEPVTCGPGTHPLNGQCAPNAVDGPVVRIASCVVIPDSIKVAPNAEFQFKNEDAVDRTITGEDGKVWVTAKAGLSSPIVAITRTGTWRYRVSDCAKGGAVVVE